jgi:hypothetical protein
MEDRITDDSTASDASIESLDDKLGNCRSCGHPFNPHIIIAYDVEDLSKGGEMRCPVEGCACFSTISFNFNQESNRS